MAELNYLTFDLWIGRTAEGYLAKGRDSCDREATVTFAVPFQEAETEDFWRRIGAHGARRHGAGPEEVDGAVDREPRPGRSSPAEALKHCGGSLFKALFYDDLLSTFRSSLEQAGREGSGLRIRLRLTDVPELAGLPWEYLYDPSCDRFFALSVATPVVRYLELPEPLRPLTVRPPLEMLVMIASPGDYPALDAEREWRRLNETLGDLRRRGLLRLERLEGATLAALQRRLRRGGVHVFHFIGHGSFDRRSRTGALILEDESGRGRAAGAEDLGMVLHDHAPRLVVLNACDGARSSPRNPFAGVAQTLIRQGASAVVAMQTEVLDDFALTLAHELYGALADGYPVDACLAEARKSLAGRRLAAWGTPVLYLRAPDGRILDVEDRGDGAAVAGSPTPGPPIYEPTAEAPAAAAYDEEPENGAAARWPWAGIAAAVVLGAFLVVAYDRWRQPPVEDDVQSAALESAALESAALESAATDSPAEDVADAEPAAGIGRDAENPETGARQPAVVETDPRIGKAEPIVETPEREQPAPPKTAETGPEPEPPPEPLPARTAAPSWPRGSGPRDVRRNEKDGQQYAWIPAGRFRFGCSKGDDRCADDEKPASDQTIEHGFWLGQTEVTVRAYKEFRGDSLLPPPPSFNSGWGNEMQPMLNVSRTDADRFCEWAGGRLPTEIEWEYAARAGEPQALPADLAGRAWFAGQQAHEVHRKEPNAFGLYDVLGNAGEWVAPSPGESVGVLRGGSWLHAEPFLRFSFRLTVDPGERTEMYGFRCLVEPS